MAASKPFDAAHVTLDRKAFRLYKATVQKARRTVVDPPRRAVFVAGAQRSGTNMIMEVLERNLQTTVFHESDPRAFDDFQLREEAVLRDLFEGADGEVVVYKALLDLDIVPRLMESFAPARTVWMIRPFADMINSHMDSRFGRKGRCPALLNRMALDPADGGWRGAGMSEDTHDLIVRHSHPGMTMATAVALFWYMRNVLLLELGLDRDPRVIVMGYDALVTDPDSEIARMFDFLGLANPAFAARHIHAGSVRRKPMPDIAPPVLELCQDLQERLDAVVAAHARLEAAE